MNISILTDSKTSWFIPYGRKLEHRLTELGHNVCYVFDKSHLKNGDVCFLLSCTRIVENDYLTLNKNNIVIHASDLPHGKGFSPLQWQILEGNNSVILSVIEAENEVDAGPIYFKHTINFSGHELYDELRDALGKEIITMCVKYINNYKKLRPVAQVGEGSFYPRRTTKDDEIDPTKTVLDLFNNFRIADNENYPLYFHFKGNKYSIKVEKISTNSESVQNKKNL